MSEFKGSKGEVEIIEDANKEYFVLEVSDGINNWGICQTITNYDIDKANSNLIVDAFKVRQQINCELSELLEQNKEMLAMLYYCKIVIGEVPKTINIKTLERRVEQLIKKVKDNE